MRPTPARVQQVTLALIVLGVPVQVYLIAAYAFGAGSGARDAHKAHARADRWLGGFHGLFALLVGLSFSLLIGGRRELGAASLL